MSQESTSTKLDLVELLEREGVTSTSAKRGRHRAEARTVDHKGVVATVAVAAGALLATGYQVGNPVSANAAENGADQHDFVTPVANPLPGLPPLPPELQAGVQQFADFAANLGKAPETTAPETTAPGTAAPTTAEPISNPAPGVPPLPPEIQAGIDQINQFGEDLAAQFLPKPPAVRPVNGTITSGYGARWGSMHYGLDFANPIGTPIQAVSSGTVIEAGPASGFGLWVRVRHDDGTVSVYGHVNDITTHVGKRVNAGETIATVGNRGWSTGPHLHLEIWEPNGAKVDPAHWLVAHGVALGLGAANA